jgi:hypothetical protein
MTDKTLHLPKKEQVARNSLVEDIARKAREERAAQRGETLEPEAETPEPEVEAAEPEVEAPEPEVETETPAEELITIKVDGKEQQVPISKVRDIGVRALQKELAADARLNEAAQRAKELEERENQIKQREMLARDLELRYKQDNAGPPKGAQDFKETAKKVLNAIYDDDQDKAADALTQLFAGRQSATPDVDTVVRQAAQAAREAARQEYEERKAREDHVKAVEAFKQTFPDIVSDQRLFDQADRETLVVKKEHPDWALPQILEEAGKRVSEWKRHFGGSEVTQKATARKQSLDNPSSASVRHSPPPAQEPKTASQTIAEMRKARGLPV